MKKAITILITLTGIFTIQAQQLTQNVHGRIVDAQSKTPLPGATVILEGSDPVIGTSSGPDGYFTLNNIPVGRQNFRFTFTGYEEREISNIIVLSGKETVLDVELTEAIVSINEVKVTASRQNREKPINTMASVSARQFTVEETKRYAGSLFDPARMAGSFAGVASLDGETNEIIVRGNSPRGMLWRLEGIEIPNPNHFRDGEGASGGGVSMINSEVMANSDFFTGAFPAEYGNALSGVFDINFRKGNAAKREYSLQVGVLGAQASLEGPFRNGGQSSYLLNYRHAVFTMLEKVGITVGDNDIQPAFDDLAMNLNFVTKKAGNISLFALGGISTAGDVATEDSTAWEYRSDKYNEKEYHRAGIVGLKHFYPFKNQKTYIKTLAVVSHEYNEVIADTLGYNYVKGIVQNDKFAYPTFRLSSMLNHKFNARNTLRSGIIYSSLWFNILGEGMDLVEDRFATLVDNKGSSFSLQAYTQWQRRFSNAFDINAGAHFTCFGLNGDYSIEPRTSVKWKFAPGQSVSYGIGVHSRIEALSVYLSEIPREGGTTLFSNKNTGLTKALHNVIGYDLLINKDLRMKVEAYYQYLYDVMLPVDTALKSSGVNFMNGLVDIELNNNGTAYNYGLEFTLEKFFSDNYYFLITTSLFESKYKAANGNTYNSLFNGNYIVNLLAGKELAFKNKSSLSFNGKCILKGGNRTTPLDLEATILENDEVFIEDRYLEDKVKDFLRVDFSATFRKNLEKMSWELSLDIQNTTNRKNVYSSYWDNEKHKILYYYFPGLLPILNFRIVF